MWSLGQQQHPCELLKNADSQAQPRPANQKVKEWGATAWVFTHSPGDGGKRTFPERNFLVPCPSHLQERQKRDPPPKDGSPTPSEIPRSEIPRTILVCDMESLICTVRFLVLVDSWAHCSFLFTSVNHAGGRLAAGVWRERFMGFHQSVQNSGQA